jgi:hypothetical protein
LVPLILQPVLVTFCRKNANQQFNPHRSQNADCLIRSIHASQPYYELMFDIRGMSECSIYWFHSFQYSVAMGRGPTCGLRTIHQDVFLIPNSSSSQW